MYMSSPAHTKGKKKKKLYVLEVDSFAPTVCGCHIFCLSAAAQLFSPAGVRLAHHQDLFSPLTKLIDKTQSKAPEFSPVGDMSNRPPCVTFSHFRVQVEAALDLLH